ncbi:MAG: penicillin-binding protein 2, partial [Candidatus Moranbacteria bacterium]|nr:penicillin-binding protein 2 [Candidatus Moranbacteria bacterium]
GMEIEDYVLTATEKEASRMERPLEKKWLDYFWWSIVFVILFLSARIIFLTVIKGAHYRNIARGNSVRSITIKAPRGRIFDRFGVALVSNIPSIDVVMVPSDLPEGEAEITKISQNLSLILKIDQSEIRTKLENSKSSFNDSVILKENISQDESLSILEQGELLQGISIEKTAIRQYSDARIFSHILGYEGKIEQKELEKDKSYVLTDYVGKQGIEKSYEDVLRGIHGANQVEVDSSGNSKREIGIVNPRPGSDLVLNIDAGLQKKIYDSINKILEETGTKTAAAVAIDPKTGGILAIVNVPSYDNNLFAKKISADDYSKLIKDADKPLFNRAISGEYPPGSTIKPAIASAALSEGNITSATVIDGLNGSLNIGGFSFGDWKIHGPSDVRTAIAQSNDIFFYTIGGGYGNIRGLGMDTMKKYYNLFGFGEKTGVDIGGEVAGFIPSQQWKQDKLGEKWYIGNSYHASIGQGYVTATPLQLANYVASIANGGTLYQPHIVSQIKKSTGETENIKPEKIRSGFISQDVLKVVQEGMRQTVTDGTAQTLKSLSVEVAGKTGTAQFGSTGQTHGWFVCYAPYDDPQIAMAVLVEGGGEGHSSALPITQETLEWYFNR